MTRAQTASRSREPSLREQIADSGETEISATRAALGEDLTDRRFLGREFLTWLLYHCDSSYDEHADAELHPELKAPLSPPREGRFAATKDCAAFRILIGERVILKALGDGSGEIAARGPATGYSADVRYAIAGGLTVREVDLLFERDDRIWQGAVNAENFDIKRAKLPSLLSEEDSERAAERLELIAELDAMLRTAFQSFLRIRLDSQWQSEVVPALRVWLARSILEKKQLELAMSEIASKGKGTGRRGKDSLN